MPLPALLHYFRLCSNLRSRQSKLYITTKQEEALLLCNMQWGNFAKLMRMKGRDARRGASKSWSNRSDCESVTGAQLNEERAKGQTNLEGIFCLQSSNRLHNDSQDLSKCDTRVGDKSLLTRHGMQQTWWIHKIHIISAVISCALQPRMPSLPKLQGQIEGGRMAEDILMFVQYDKHRPRRARRFMRRPSIALHWLHP